MLSGKGKIGGCGGREDGGEREGHRTCLQSMNREFVHRGKAMYRTLLATCGSANNKCLYLIYNRRMLLGVILQ